MVATFLAEDLTILPKIDCHSIEVQRGGNLLFSILL